MLWHFLFFMRLYGNVLLLSSLRASFLELYTLFISFYNTSFICFFLLFFHTNHLSMASVVKVTLNKYKKHTKYCLLVNFLYPWSQNPDIQNWVPTCVHQIIYIPFTIRFMPICHFLSTMLYCYLYGEKVF